MEDEGDFEGEEGFDFGEMMEEMGDSDEEMEEEEFEAPSGYSTTLELGDFFSS